MSEIIYQPGFLVTSATPSPFLPKGIPYQGVAYGEAWPLTTAMALDNTDKLLLKRIDDYIFDNHSVSDSANGVPIVLRDMNLVNYYLDCCHRLKVETRLLLVVSAFIWPAGEQPLNVQGFGVPIFLGYDYVSSDCRYSALIDDLYPLPDVSFQPWFNLLNKYGLYSQKDDLESYARFRQIYLEKNNENIKNSQEMSGRESILEDSIDLIKVAVYQ